MWLWFVVGHKLLDTRPLFSFQLSSFVFLFWGALIRASPLRAHVLNYSLAQAEPIICSVVPWPEQSPPSCAVNERRDPIV